MIVQSGRKKPPPWIFNCRPHRSYFLHRRNVSIDCGWKGGPVNPCRADTSAATYTVLPGRNFAKIRVENLNAETFKPLLPIPELLFNYYTSNYLTYFDVLEIYWNKCKCVPSLNPFSFKFSWAIVMFNI